MRYLHEHLEILVQAVTIGEIGVVDAMMIFEQLHVRCFDCHPNRDITIEKHHSVGNRGRDVVGGVRGGKRGGC